MQSQPTRRLLFKTANDGLIAHVYEHIVADSIHRELRRHHTFLLVDYSLWAMTSGRTCTLDVRFAGADVARLFDSDFRDVSQRSLTETDIAKALRECGCEYMRRADIKSNASVHICNELQRAPWHDTADYMYDVCPEPRYVDAHFSAHGLHLTSAKPDAFHGYVVEYVVPAKVFTAHPYLRPLAMIVIQALALNHISMLSEPYTFYDVGDAWDEGAARVAYRHHMRFLKDQTPSRHDIKTTIMANHAYLLDHGLAGKLHSLIMNTFSQPYFDTEDFSRTCGVVIGYKGWQEVAAHDTIAHLMDAVKMRVIDSSDIRVA